MHRTLTGRTTAALAAAALAALTLAACGSSGTGSASKPPAGPSPSAQVATFPVTEGSATVTAKPQKIVSLAPTTTDMLVAIGAGSQIVAVDKDSTPVDFQGCQNLGLSCSAPSPLPPANLDAFQPNAEAVAALQPDLVVISNDQNKIQESLTALKIPVYVAPAAMTIDDTYKEFTELGALTGNPGGAAVAVAAERKAISDTLATLKPQAKPLTYYYELDQTYYSVTSKTFIGSLFTMAHMTNIADPSDADGKAGGYPQLSAETIINANPDAIFLADGQCCGQSDATVAKRPGWSALSAVKGGHVKVVPDDVASQWGTTVVALFKDIVDESNTFATS